MSFYDMIYYIYIDFGRSRSFNGPSVTTDTFFIERPYTFSISFVFAVLLPFLP